jgi:hypothetical protein
VLRGVLGEELLLTSVDPGLVIEIVYALLFALATNWDSVAKTLVLGLFADWWQRDESAVNATLVQAEVELFEAGGSLAPAES